MMFVVNIAWCCVVVALFLSGKNLSLLLKVRDKIYDVEKEFTIRAFPFIRTIIKVQFRNFRNIFKIMQGLIIEHQNIFGEI